MYDMTATGKRMKEKREENGFSKSEVAEILQSSRATLIRWEEGKTVPRVDVMAELAALYKCKIDDLVVTAF